MGFSNGNLTSKTTNKEKGEKGLGFSLTVDNHYHIRNKRLTNVSPPINDGDAITRKFVPDLLKGKAGTTYVNNALAKKANNKYVNDVVSSSLEDYYTKTEIDDAKTRAANQPFLFIKRTTHSNKVCVKFSTALSDQINHPTGENGVSSSK